MGGSDYLSKNYKQVYTTQCTITKSRKLLIPKKLFVIEWALFLLSLQSACSK